MPRGGGGQGEDASASSSWPPQGAALRGTTLGPQLAGGPARYFAEYGHTAHVYRTFRAVPTHDAASAGQSGAAASLSQQQNQQQQQTEQPLAGNVMPSMELTAAELDHVARGGYLWYNLKCRKVQPCVDGDHDAELRAAAAAVAQQAPAMIIVCVQHELDHHLGDAPPDARTGKCPAPGRDDCTSGANMRALYGRVQRIFDEAGVANAVWAVDFSTHAGAETHASVEATWPVHRDGYPNAAYEGARVDFVFFNAFLQAYRVHTVRDDGEDGDDGDAAGGDGGGDLLRGDGGDDGADDEEVVGSNPLLELVVKGYNYHAANPLYAHLPLGLGAFGIHDWKESFAAVGAAPCGKQWQTRAQGSPRLLPGFGASPPANRPRERPAVTAWPMSLAFQSIGAGYSLRTWEEYTLRGFEGLRRVAANVAAQASRPGALPAD